MDYCCGDADPVMRVYLEVDDPYLKDMGDSLYEDDGDGIEPTEGQC
jgi:hypothetical protein